MSDEKCPHCGAVVIHYGKDDKPWFCCGNGTLNRSDACYQAEITKLRAKKAKGLTWEPTCRGRALMAQTPHGYMMILVFADEYRLLNRIRGEEKKSDHETIELAKAHAEELHQQAWRELRTKWDAK